ncbi:hypothetical protein N657DRAFT_649589 [Parathielavia appendiculata]|uniref:Uncharacterized protein n=1 Tax=Parathielavia appendiculata TaxID=2587402 RepID=A0AAN6TT75_9PEZI|nr:hypothetical protein N657DRAFT_649589 [Parathielavia appendiculata]
MPIIPYPAEYVRQVPMTDTTLQQGPTSPGLTYTWYNSKAAYPFGYSLYHAASFGRAGYSCSFPPMAA